LPEKNSTAIEGHGLSGQKSADEHQQCIVAGAMQEGQGWNPSEMAASVL
jgi:hypothetical protein